jgi:hypothetical protein
LEQPDRQVQSGIDVDARMCLDAGPPDAWNGPWWQSRIKGMALDVFVEFPSPRLRRQQRIWFGVRFPLRPDCSEFRREGDARRITARRQRRVRGLPNALIS